MTLFVAAAASALAAAGPDALVPFRAVAGAAASEVQVAFVIDFGGSAHASVGCVKVPASDNGYAALAAFTAQEHEQAPTYNSTGLLCSINGIPSSGCGQVVSDGYIYWSYWEAAAGKWKYAEAGAFGAVTNGEIQGWRFQDPGKANPSDPPPTTRADFAAICASASSPTTTTTTTRATPAGTSTTTTTVSTEPSPGTTPSAIGQGKSNGSGPTPTSSSGKGSSTSSPKGAAGRSTRTTDPPTKAPESKPGKGGSSSSTSTNPSGGSHPQALSATATDDRSRGGDSAVPLIIGTLFILALLVVAVIRWRRRPGSP